MDQALCNLNWSAALLDGLVEGGVKDLVVSPGSRNTPLLLAGEQHPALKAHVLVDERSAAFFALGLARATTRPAALVATSGTAVANWFPAVVEASQSGLPLILISADRPWELQQCGANQTVDQQKLFGDYCRAFYALPAAEEGEETLKRVHRLALQAVDKSYALDPGPVQINMPFREPLATSNSAVFKVSSPSAVPCRPVLQPSEQQLLQVKEQISGRPGIIVAGNGCGAPDDLGAITELADKLAVPVLADPLSGLRWNTRTKHSIITHYDLFLAREDFSLTTNPEWIIRFGAMPVSSRLQKYLQHHASADHIVIEDRGRWQDPLNLATGMIHANSLSFCRQLARLEPEQAPAGLRADFLGSDQKMEQELKDGAEGLPLEAQAIRSLLDLLPDKSQLFCGNSLSVRFLDAYSSVMDKEIRVAGNRGTSGIDGNVSTLMGLAAGSGDRPKVVGIMGDLAFFHDLNGLNMARELEVVLVVFNNNGGGIFEHLPQSSLPGFETYWKTPLNMVYRQAAELFRLRYAQVNQISEFPGAVKQALQKEGSTIIEVMVDGKQSQQAHLNIQS